MRIAFTITELNVGGAEKALTELAIGLKDRGHELHVFSIGSRPESPKDSLVRRMERRSIPISFGGFDKPWEVFGAKRWLKGCLQQHARQGNPIAVVQSFLFHANCLGVVAARAARIPICVGGLRVAEQNRLRLWLERRATRQMTHLVSVSRGVERFAQRELAVPPERSSVIPNGVSIDRWADASAVKWTELNWPAESQVVLFVGRLHPQKGLELIQHEAQGILQADPRRRILLIGDGPLRAGLQRWASETDSGRIRILPWQSDVAPYLRAASLCVLPSHYEGMPNVILEAMAAGSPVVCSRVEGSEELLGPPGQSRADRQSFPIGDAAMMSSKINALLDNPDQRRAIGAENQSFVRAGFTYDAMVSRYEDLYAKLLRESSC
ncbi:MAG: glycosyltransferase [Planctomycetota bacterium]